LGDPMQFFQSRDEAVSDRAPFTPRQQSTLAEGARGCDSSAEEELICHFSERVRFLVLSRTRDPEAARDLTQDVLLAVVQALRNGHLREAERLPAFVYGTARNLINNYLRTRSRRLPRECPISDELCPASAPDPIESTERVVLVQQVLKDLDEIDRQVLLMTLIEGLKPGEIAIRHGLTSEVVRTRKSRALRKVIGRVRRLSRI
jgi:RNA polymerase sigma factor (sigma-70 family)